MLFKVIGAESAPWLRMREAIILDLYRNITPEVVVQGIKVYFIMIIL